MMIAAHRQLCTSSQSNSICSSTKTVGEAVQRLSDASNKHRLIPCTISVVTSAIVSFRYKSEMQIAVFVHTTEQNCKSFLR